VPPPGSAPTDTPLPPGFDFEIVFDGGSLGNPGRGYGSYRLRGRAVDARVERLDFGQAVTNNEAEYRALIGGLEDVLGVLAAQAHPAEQARVLALGDSLLVVNQLTAGWKVKSANLVPLHRRARELAARFGRFELRWQPRSRSVRVLGH
jgi:probable phosphoglycerate mutase